VSPRMQRLAVSLESAVYGWIDLVAGGGSDPGDHDPLASPRTQVVTAEPAPADALAQAS